jgi:hypothetical protein
MLDRRTLVATRATAGALPPWAIQKSLQNSSQKTVMDQLVHFAPWGLCSKHLISVWESTTWKIWLKTADPQ